MRLGTSSPLKHDSAEEWAKNQIALGCRSVVFPLSSDDPEDKIKEYIYKNYEEVKNEDGTLPLTLHDQNILELLEEIE